MDFILAMIGMKSMTMGNPQYNNQNPPTRGLVPRIQLCSMILQQEVDQNGVYVGDVSLCHKRLKISAVS